MPPVFELNFHFYCASTGFKKAIEMLIEKGANINAVEDRWKMTPLHYVARAEAARHHQDHWTEDDYLSKFRF